MNPLKEIIKKRLYLLMPSIFAIGYVCFTVLITIYIRYNHRNEILSDYPYVITELTVIISFITLIIYFVQTLFKKESVDIT